MGFYSTRLAQCRSLQSSTTTYPRNRRLTFSDASFVKLLYLQSTSLDVRDQGMELAFGTGVTSLATMCGAFSTACRVLQGEGVPRSSVLHGFRVAEDLCVDVLRGLSVRTAHVGQERQEYRGHGAACRQNTRDIIPRSPVSIPTLAHLAAGLQHCAGCNHAAATDQEERVSKLARFTPCDLTYV